MVDLTLNTQIDFTEKESLRALRKMLRQYKDKDNTYDYESLFKQYLKKETDLSTEEITMQVDNIESLGIFDKLEEEQNNNEETTSNELDTFDEVLNILFEEEEILKNLDVNSDNILDDEEKTAYLNAISSLDGNGEDLTLEEILSSAKGMMEGKTLEEITMLAEADSVIEEPNSATVEDVQKAGGGSKLSRQNTNPSNYTGPDGTLNSKTTETTTENKIKEIEQQIAQKNDEKITLKAGEVEYSAMITELKTINDNISKSEGTIETYNRELHKVSYDLNAVTSQLENMQEPVIFTEYKDEYTKQKQELESKKLELTKQQKDWETKIEEEQQVLNKLQEDKTIKEQEIEEYEQAHPNDEIDKINAEIKELENEKEELQKALEEERQQELSDAKVYGKAQAHRESELVKFMMDYATDPETKKKYDEWYFKEFNGKAYCAIFTSDVVKIMYAKAAQAMGIDETKLQEMYQNTDKTCPKNRGVGSLYFASSVSGTAAWGEEMQTALNNAGINVDATVDITQMSETERKNAVRDGKVYPGMAFTYMENGRLHIGFVESINADLSWNTIEGNTSVNGENHTVGAHKRDALNPDLSTVTDATTKVLYWMKYSGRYSDEEINGLIY
ncbi:hypothetical protein IJX73_03855 [bacterium]|nr:hypothetical protein [bacterium]MBQ9150046.1 hypothetical protein [bacterium]